MLHIIVSIKISSNLMVQDIKAWHRYRHNPIRVENLYYEIPEAISLLAYAALFPASFGSNY